MGEHSLIRWIRSRLGKRDGRIVVDSGDDAAVVRFGGTSVLFKTDSVVDDVHFESGTARPESVGHKAIARCLSDVAAMACHPSFAVVALLVPVNAREAYIKRVLAGLERTAKRFGVAVVGGDVASHSGKLSISVALLGETRGLRPIRRHGARPGDALLVTGPLGGSILGKHLTFTPRVKEALELRRRAAIHAMIDLSDGLATDLGHLCRESRVGAIVDADAVPVSAAARKLSRKDKVPALKHALGDGEDYELLFAAPKADAAALVKARKATVIGEVAPVEGIYLRDAAGGLAELKGVGWEHRFGR
jgi:thiamine-monophosphate kinase